MALFDAARGREHHRHRQPTAVLIYFLLASPLILIAPVRHFERVAHARLAIVDGRVGWPLGDGDAFSITAQRSIGDIF
jgi:hypothetical protein